LLKGRGSKFAPVIVTTVPVGPDTGVKDVMTGGFEKIAITALFVCITSVSGGSVLFVSPLQRAKVHPDFGVAVSITIEFEANRFVAGE